MRKDLWTDLGAGDPIRVRALADEHAEARAVLSSIEELADEGVPRSDIAVFYRTNAQSRVLEDTLVRAEVPYQVIGGTKFYERAEIKDAVAYLSLLANPADQVSFTRVANSPRRGIGQTSLSRVIGYAATLGEPVFHVAATADTVPGLGPAAVARDRALHGHDGRAARDGRRWRAGRRAARGGARTHAATSTRSRPSGRSRRAGGSRTSRSWSASRASSTTVPTARAGSTRSWRRSRSSRTPTRAIDDRGLVTLMTLHNAKGLEYPIVFIIGCEEGVFPHSRSLDEGSLEEERRLCYVGITRAMRVADDDLRAAPLAVRGRELRPAQPLPRRDPDRADRAPTTTCSDPRPMTISATRTGGAGIWAAASAGGLAAERERAAEAAQQFRIGEDVAHAAFGEGVVTGLEPGGIVVVRFARDGSERKLLAGIAPVRSR